MGFFLFVLVLCFEMILFHYLYPILHKMEWLKPDWEFGIDLMGFSGVSVPLSGSFIGLMIASAG